MCPPELHRTLPWREAALIVRASRTDDGRFLSELSQDEIVRAQLGNPTRPAEVKEEALRKNPYDLLIVEINDSVCGYAGYFLNDHTEEMDILIVLDREHRGAGWGTKLLTLLTGKWQMMFPDKSLSVSTRKTNIAAQRLLLRAGFKQDEEYEDRMSSTLRHVIFRPGT